MNKQEEKYSEKETNVLNEKSYKKLYSYFRSEEMGMFESFFNAIYLLCRNNYENSEGLVKKYDSVPEHPKGWSEDKIKLHKHNIWSLLTGFLDFFVNIYKGISNIREYIRKLFRKIARIPHGMDNSIRASKALLSVFLGIALPLTAILLTVNIISSVSAKTDENYSVGVYIDGEYKGNTQNANSILNIKRSLEENLSQKYGSPIVLECDVKMIPQKYDEDSIISSGDTSIFDEYLSSYTKNGYGLYIDNNLAAVSEVEKWLDDTVDEYLSRFSDDSKDEIVFSNSFRITADRYPESYFLTLNELRELFSVDGENVSLSIDYSNLKDVDESLINPSAPATAKVDIAVEKEEKETILIPCSVTTIEDDTMLEGMRRLVKPGKDGKKVIYYKNTYVNRKLVKQEVVKEEFVSSPVAKVVYVGTREATEEEKKLIPTGTYIYPHRGKLTSKFGWRTVKGKYGFHQGLDICGNRGDSIVAADGGEVVEVKYSPSYGNYCVIRHNEEYETKYAHCDAIDVEVGDLVGKGFHIARMGSTGNSTGNHVHFEIIKNGTRVNPLDYIQDTPIQWHLLT